MINTKSLTILFVSVILALATYAVIAQNKVVVMPMGLGSEITSYEIVRNIQQSIINSNGIEYVTADCPAGKKVMGGGGIVGSQVVVFRLAKEQY